MQVEKEKPSVLTAESSTCFSTTSSNTETSDVQKTTPPVFCYDDFEPPPLIPPGTVVSIGCFVFLLAMLWPPLILVVTALAARVIPYCYRVNDSGASRRYMLHKFMNEDPVAIRRQQSFPTEDVELTSSYWTNSRGLLLHTNIMVPRNQEVKAVVCFCHGYVDNPTWSKLPELSKFLVKKSGLALIMVEHEGHGRSDGTLGLIKDWDVIMNDAHEYFQETAGNFFPTKQLFLMGESLGGAMAYTMIQKYPESYSGVVFLCPMCKIADDMMPPEFVVKLGRKLAGPTGTATLLGFLPIAPSKGDLIKFSFKLEEKRKVLTRQPAVFKRQPRMATAREMLDVTKRISESLSTFDAPFLVQHGLSDRVTDPKLSQALYDEACSKDKTIKLYEGMWHSMTNGEPDENIEKVFNDSIEWILERVNPDNSKKTQ
mmetsp:Transcript_29039/g.54557  ORF Transcript_29039/g.54557 Transcript_29039/m.54557 type:complete len:428 (-) Transcript_29039:502-1785(-)